MPEYPRDRFDRAPDELARVGAHRAPKRPGRGWITFGWAALATAVLVGLGVLGLTQIDRNVADTGATAASEPSAKATIDPKIDVVLLNATTTSGLAAGARTKAEAQGWHVVSTANANATNVATTTVYYTVASQAGAAAGLAKTLGTTRTRLSSQFAVQGTERLTVVLGRDYAAKQ